MPRAARGARLGSPWNRRFRRGRRRPLSTLRDVRRRRVPRADLGAVSSPLFSASEVEGSPLGTRGAANAERAPAPYGALLLMFRVSLDPTKQARRLFLCAEYQRSVHSTELWKSIGPNRRVFPLAGTWATALGYNVDRSRAVTVQLDVKRYQIKLLIKGEVKRMIRVSLVRLMPARRWLLQQSTTSTCATQVKEVAGMIEAEADALKVHLSLIKPERIGLQLQTVHDADMFRYSNAPCQDRAGQVTAADWPSRILAMHAMLCCCMHCAMNPRALATCTCPL